MSCPPSYCDVKESQHRTGAPLNSKVTPQIAELVFQDKRSPQGASTRPFLVVWSAKLGVPFSLFFQGVRVAIPPKATLSNYAH